ncbi:8309_t:CDS:2, partial [Gigaspora margarita]
MRSTSLYYSVSLLDRDIAFDNEAEIQENDKPMTYLCAIDKEKIDLTEKRTNIYEQKVLYSTLHGMYKKALQKALQTKSNSR